MAFIAALWLMGSVFLATCLSVPTLLGRQLFAFATSREVHDGYSFLLGFHVLWAAWHAGVAFQMVHARRLLVDAETTRLQTAIYCLKRGVIWTAQIAYLTFMLGIVIPVLLGLVVEMYFVLPMRPAQGPTPEISYIRLADMWALGLLYAKITMNSRPLQPRGNAIADGIAAVRLLSHSSPQKQLYL